MLDIDECLENNDNCEQICVNTDGNFTCECFPNYSLVNASHCEGNYNLRVGFTYCDTEIFQTSMSV